MCKPLLLLARNALDRERSCRRLLLQLLTQLGDKGIDPVASVTMRGRGHALRAICGTIGSDVLGVLGPTESAQRRALLIVLGRRGRQVVSGQLPEREIEGRPATSSGHACIRESNRYLPDDLCCIAGGDLPYVVKQRGQFWQPRTLRPDGHWLSRRGRDT